MKYTVLLLLSVLALLLGCADEDKNETPPPVCYLNDYVPFELNNWWRYISTHWGGGPTEVDTSLNIIDSTAVVLGGVTAYRLKDIDPDLTEYTWLVVVNNELRMYETLPHDTAGYYIFLRCPFNVGSTWPYYSRPIFGQTIMATLVDNNATITVPAGTFHNCLHVAVSPYFHAYFAANIGLLRGANAYPDSSAGVDDQLLSYYVAP
ncbi:hypothetical protein KKH27_03150 [bacterium]|nr:hypothetical protein [bacterium]MBU1983012.1 hypothetical protein [bacterium]